MIYPTSPTQDRRVTAAAGTIAIIFGLAAILWPGPTIRVLLTLFAIYVLVYGALEVAAMFRARREGQTWWTHLLVGAIGIIAGLVTLFYPNVTSTLLVYFIAIWAIALGIAEILAAASQREWLLGIVGGITLAVGIVLFANAPSGALALVWVIGVLALVRGVLLLLPLVLPELSHQAGP